MVSSLEDLRRELDVLADLNRGRLPDLNNSTVQWWLTRLPDLFQILDLLGGREFGIGAGEFRDARDAAVRRWHSRWTAQRLKRERHGRHAGNITRVTPAVRTKMREMYDGGQSITDISRTLGVHRQTARNEISTYEVERHEQGLPARPIRTR